jgi:penicillin amidase
MYTPLESSLFYLFGNSAFAQKPYALSWVGLQKQDRTIDGLFEMIKAKNAKEFLRATRKLDSMPAAMAFATSEGDIGFKATGKIPLRKSYESLNLMRNGSLPEDDITEYIPDDETPYVINPKSGFIVSCNNKIVPFNYKYIVGNSITTTMRSMRGNEMIKERIASGKKADVEFMKEMQYDVMDVSARDLVPMLLKVVENSKHLYYEKGSTEDKTISKMQRLLSNWDFKQSGDSIGALVYNVWELEIMDNLLHQQVGNRWIRKTMVREPPAVHLFGRLIQNWIKGKELYNAYCINNISATKQYPCAYITVQGLLTAFEKIVEEMGDEEKDWSWGILNRVRSISDAFSSTPLRVFFERLSLSAGNRNTLRKNFVVYLADDLDNTSGSSVRFIASLDNYNNTYIMTDSVFIK